MCSYNGRGALLVHGFGHLSDRCAVVAAGRCLVLNPLQIKWYLAAAPRAWSSLWWRKIIGFERFCGKNFA